VKLLAVNLWDADREVTMRLWELAPGSYRVSYGPDADGDDEMDEVSGSLSVEVERHTGVDLTLPCRKVQVVCVQRE